MSEKKSSRRSSAAMLIASLAVMGTIGVFRRWIPLSSALIAFARGVIGSAVLRLFAALSGRGRLPALSGKKLGALALSGAFIGLNWMLLFEAYNHTTIAAATLCYYLQPTIVLLLSPLIFGEKLTAKKLLCAAAAVLGMVLVSGVIGGGGPGAGVVKGALLALGAAFFYALVVVMNKKLTGVDIYEKTIVQLLGAAAVMVPYLLLTEDLRAVHMTGMTAALLLTVGVIHTGAAYAFYFRSMEGLPAQTISMLSYTDPIVALILSALIFRERLTIPVILGAVLILGSAFVSERAD